MICQRYSVIILASLALSSACAPKEIELDDLPRSFSDAFCDWAIGCGEFGEGDHDFCAKTVGIEWDVSTYIVTPDVLRAIETGSVSYDGEAAFECVEAVREASCLESNIDNIFAAPSCKDVFSGSLEIGTLCWTDLQCESQFCDVDYLACSMACCAGTCAPLPNAVLGQPCPTGYCIDGSICDYDTETCVPKQVNGGPCIDSYDCADGLACLGYYEGVCSLPRNEGEFCVGEACGRMGLSCDTTTNVCVQVQHAGALCNPDIDLCGWGLGCNPSTNTCQVIGGIGTPCVDDYECGDWTLYCDIDYLTQTEGTCRQLKANGAACTSPWECQGSKCTDGVCAPEASCVP